MVARVVTTSVVVALVVANVVVARVVLARVVTASVEGGFDVVPFVVLGGLGKVKKVPGSTGEATLAVVPLVAAGSVNRLVSDWSLADDEREELELPATTLLEDTEPRLLTGAPPVPPVLGGTVTGALVARPVAEVAKEDEDRTVMPRTSTCAVA